MSSFPLLKQLLRKRSSFRPANKRHQLARRSWLLGGFLKLALELPYTPERSNQPSRMTTQKSVATCYPSQAERVRNNNRHWTILMECEGGILNSKNIVNIMLKIVYLEKTELLYTSQIPPQGIWVSWKSDVINGLLNRKEELHKKSLSPEGTSLVSSE